MTAHPAPTALDVVVTPMRRRHLPEVLRIERAVHRRPWSEVLYLAELEQPATREYLVARAGPRVVGYAGLMVVLEDSHVTNVAVDPAWQRREVATRLLLQLLRRSVERGARHATLEVRMSNTAAQALYRRFGFAPAGVRRRYYVDDHEDALVMWARDLDEPAYGRRLEAIEAGLAGGTRLEGWRRRQGST